MHLAPKHLCICFNSSIFRLSAWIFPSASSVDGIVPTSTDCSIVQWLDVLVNIYIPVTFTMKGQIRFLKFSRLVIDISWLSCDDLHCSNFRWPDRELRCLYQDIPWPIFIIFEVLMDETVNEGSSSDPFRTLSCLKQLGHTCDWSCLTYETGLIAHDLILHRLFV